MAQGAYRAVVFVHFDWKKSSHLGVLKNFNGTLQTHQPPSHPQRRAIELCQVVWIQQPQQLRAEDPTVEPNGAPPAKTKAPKGEKGLFPKWDTLKTSRQSSKLVYFWGFNPKKTRFFCDLKRSHWHVVYFFWLVDARHHRHAQENVHLITSAMFLWKLKVRHVQYLLQIFGLDDQIYDQINITLQVARHQNMLRSTQKNIQTKKTGLRPRVTDIDPQQPSKRCVM